MDKLNWMKESKTVSGENSVEIVLVFIVYIEKS